MSLKNLKTIAIICNYEIREDRIGGMDRFFLAFDAKAETLGYKVSWFFIGQKRFGFYDGLDITITSTESVETLFLNHLRVDNATYTHVITHFIELCTSFYKVIKIKTQAYCIAVDHNPRPLRGYAYKKRIKLKIKGLIYSKYIDKFVAVSKYTKKQILNDFGNCVSKKIIIVYNGIDTQVIKEQRVKRSDLKFIVASHLRPSKGVQDLLLALSFLSDDEKHKFKIDIFGEGPIESELKIFTKRKGLQEIVSFKGSSSDLPTLFSNYSYMIQPTYMECFSLSILESLAANVPVITTQVGGNLEIISAEENGYIFQAGDIQALSAIISDLISGKKGIIDRVDEKIENFYNLERMVNEHIDLLV